MPKKVICRKYKKELDGMEKPPYPGPKGEDLFNNVSQKLGMSGLNIKKC